MSTTILVEHPWLTTVALAALVVLGPVVGHLLVARPRLSGWLGVAALLPIAVLTLAPTSRSLAVGCAIEWSLPTLGAVELMANVVLFVPAVLLLAVATGRPVLVLLAASLASGLVELVQALVPALGRSCSTNDWLSNTLGAALGAALATLALAVARRSARDPLGGRR
ncbi:VanZ family protein [Nocardioides zeicaulis]|uniref:VanZ family protein n=1 Tax=Nocardioides zeicaulis TaxID=1776857 RepID=A0ABV6E2T0_9ACTN